MHWRLQAGRLREILYYLRYDADVVDDGVARSGWVVVLQIDNLAKLLDSPVPESAADLREAWAENWAIIATDASKEAVETALNEFQSETLAILRALD